MTYRCRCAEASGRLRELVREASNEEALLRDLAAEGLFPLAVEDAAPAGFRRGKRRASIAAVRDLTEGLSLMIGAGLSVRDALEVAEGVFPAARGRRGESRWLVAFLAERLGAGDSFSACLEGLGATFPPLYRALVRIGERVGNLESVLARLSEYLRRQKQMRDRIVGALIYPLFVVGVALGGIILVAAVVVPKAAELFAQGGVELPANVRRLAGSANLLVGVVALLAVGGAAFFFTARAARRAGGGAAERIDALLLRLPVAGRFLAMHAMVHVSFAMEILTQNGVSVEEALLEAARSVGNAALGRALLAAREEVIGGAPLSAALLRHRLFPERVARWLRIGERSGGVERVFGQLRAYYEGEVERWSARAASLVEPLLTAAVGALLVAVVLLVIAPLFSLYGSLLP